MGGKARNCKRRGQRRFFLGTPATPDTFFSPARFTTKGRSTMPRVIHFEIHADDTERAVKFYQSLFDWQFQKWGGPMDYWLITTGPNSQPGINGGSLKRQCAIDGQAVIAYVCTVDVPSVDAYVKKITDLGGQIALPKMSIPNVGWLAYGKDTEGNIFGVMQNDPAAK